MRLPRWKFKPVLPKHLSRLKAMTLFSTLDGKGLRIVHGLLHERDYLEGEVIFDEGEEGQALYIVHSGKVVICRQGEPETGRVTEIEAGGFFGELALLDQAPRALQARAATPCKLGVLFRADVQNLLETDARTASQIALQLARHLGRRLRAARKTTAGDLDLCL